MVGAIRSPGCEPEGARKQRPGCIIGEFPLNAWTRLRGVNEQLASFGHYRRPPPVSPSDGNPTHHWPARDGWPHRRLRARDQWADEIIGDNGSADDTAAEAHGAGARVLDAKGLTIAGARNAGADAARHDWILALDTDERVTTLLKEELPRLLTAASASAYEVRRRNLYLGREQRRGGWGRDWVVRLYRREHRFIDTPVHEARAHSRDRDPGRRDRSRSLS
jgi:hypothetical protein